jgi:hypothetical protein
MRKPYEGVEDKNFYENLRIGQITQIDYNIPQIGGQVKRITYGTAQIQWADTRLGTVDQIYVSFPAAGRGWGIFAYPKPGDVVVCGFRPGGYAVILGYLMGNPFLERGTPDPENGEPQPFTSTTGQIPYRPTRYLSGGELLFKSFEGAEIYMDRFANMRFIVRQPRVDDSDTISPTVLNANISYSEEQPKIWDVWLGKARQNDLYLLGPTNSEGQPVDLPKASFNGTDVNLDLTQTLASGEQGVQIQVDVLGGFEVSSPQKILQTAQDEYTINIASAEGLIQASLALKNDGTITMTDGDTSTIKMDGAGTINLKATGASVVIDKQGKITLTAGSGTVVTVDNTGNAVTVKANTVNLTGTQVNLGGPSASHPVVVADLLALFFNTHQHISAAPGNPTSPPVVPLVPTEIASTTTKAV